MYFPNLSANWNLLSDSYLVYALGGNLHMYIVYMLHQIYYPTGAYWVCHGMSYYLPYLQLIAGLYMFDLVLVILLGL